MTGAAVVRVGLLGGGGIVDDHVRGYRRFADRIRVVAVADLAPAVASTRGRELGAAVYTDYRRLLAEAELDAVDICLPHALHADAIAAAAELGLHILCEKPLCLTPAEAVSVQAVVQAAGVTLMCAHNQLFLPAVAKARELVDAGLLGTPYEIRTSDCFVNDFDPTTMGWRADPRISGGGELIDTGYHPTYLMLHLAGAVPVEATAMLATHRLTFATTEDSAHVLYRFDNGALGHLVTSWAYYPPGPPERFAVVGAAGSLISDGTTLSYRLADGRSETFRFPEVDTYAVEIGHFADCLIEGLRPPHTEAEGIAALGMILAAYESARTRTVAPVLSPAALAPPAAG